MYRKLISLFIFTILSITHHSLWGDINTEITIHDAQDTFTVIKQARLLEDPSRQLTLEQITQPLQQQAFTPNNRQNLNLGRSRSAYWVHFQLKNTSEKAWYLLLDSMLGDTLDLYIFPTNTTPNTHQARTETSYYAKPLEDYRRHAWSLDLPINTPLDIYLRVTNGDSVINLPIKFMSANAFLNHSRWEYTLHAGLYSGMIILALYQLLMFFILHERNYLYLSGNIFFMMLTIHRTNPVFESLAFLGDTSAYFFTLPILILLITNSAYSRQMLNTEVNSPIIDKGFQIITALSILLIAITGAIPGGTVYPLMLGFFTLIFTQFSGFYIAYIKKGGTITKHFAWIYLFPVLMQTPNLILLIFNVKLWQAQQETVVAMSTLLFMLFLALLQAYRVQLLREEIQRIAATNQAKNEFITVMNHELRTPMNAIVGLSHLLSLEKGSLNATQQDYIHRLSNAVRHMMQLINNVLDHSLASQLQLAIEKKPFRLEVALKSSFSLLEPQAKQKGLDFRIDKNTDTDLTVMGDRTKLEQILNNLLFNAIKFTQDGEVILSVQAQKTDQPNTIKLSFSVKDTGEGISRDQLKDLFTPFAAAHRSQSSSLHEGSGLGLAISQQLVTHMGGKLTVESQTQQGSTFSFQLEMETAPPITTQHDHDLTALKLSPGCRILLVDDSEANRFVGAEMLRNLGATVGQANSGQGAILQLQQHPFDLVLLDISMSDMDGFAVTHWIRQHQHWQTLPIIALTAHNAESIQQQCKAAGMNNFLSKPYSYQALYHKIEQQLSSTQ